jgi:aspartate aminotransferase-like enzyme
MLTILDSVSAWAAAPLDIKDFGVDFTATASQKALGAAPGIAIVACNQEILERAEKTSPRSYYLDIKKFKKEMDNFQTPTTPAVSVLYSVKAAIDYIKQKGGFEEHRKKHQKAAEISMEFVKSIGYEVFSEKGFHSPTITGFILEGAEEIRKRLRQEYNLVTARDFGELQGRFFRICHIGNFTEEDLSYAFEAIRKVLNK